VASAGASPGGIGWGRMCHCSSASRECWWGAILYAVQPEEADVRASGFEDGKAYDK